MPFGLTNAPAVFQQFINEVLGNLLDVCMVGYLDDILIYSDSVEQHWDHIQEVLRRLQEAGLYANPKKCSFHMDTIKYLGFILTLTGLHMDPTKVAVIQSWLEPWNVCNVQSFLRFVNFYCCFITDYSQLTLPLTNLCKKTTTFQSLKNTFSTAPVLCHWAPDLQMTVEMDASDHAIAGILSVTTQDNKIHLVAFFSHSLQGAEKNYNTHNKELLAVFEAFKNWQHFLEGSAKVIDMVTDHKNLEYFTSSKKLLRHQARWAEFLGQFNMKVQFRPGRLGSKPDMLTCRWDVYMEGDNPEPTATNICPVFTIEQLAGTPVLAHARTMEDPTPSNNLDHDTLAESITTAYAEDDLAKKICEQIKTANQPDGWMEREGCLLFHERKYVLNKGTLRLHTIRDHHNHPTAGHFRETKTTELICRNYHWPGLRRMVGDYIRSCTSCACTKATCHKPYGLLKQLPIPGQPWESISMDFIEQLPMSEGFTAILVIMDRLTKQSLFIPTHDTVDTPQLAQLFLTHVFSKHGTLGHVTSDCRTEFMSHFFHSLGSLLSMKLHFTSGYHPEGDSQMERINQVLEQYLRAYTNYQQDNWAPLLPLAEFAYNNAASATTGISSFFVNKGYHPRLSTNLLAPSSSSQAQPYVADLDQLHSQLKASITEAQECYQKAADCQRIPSPAFRIGDRVYVKAKFFHTTRPSRKLAEKNLGPFEIIGTLGMHSITIHLPQQFRGVHPIFHVSQLEPAFLNPFPYREQPPPPANRIGRQNRI